MTAPVISVRDLRRSYGRGSGRFDALKGVGLDVAAGGQGQAYGFCSLGWHPREQNPYAWLRRSER